MSKFRRVAEEMSADADGNLKKSTLDERFLANFLPESPLDRVEPHARQRDRSGI